ncbi:MAG: type III secretion system chaperone [Kiritimatiellae bacterium]|nr:type III secretion system chaperone [Kiritimatiellia bacterium]
MEFKELVDDFAARHGVSGLTVEDDAAAMDIDGIVVTLVAAGDAISISADIGEPPSEGREEFSDLLLEANMQADAFFAKAPDGGAYVLVRRLALPMLDPGSFDAALEALVNMAETWRRLLADFRPVAKAAAERTEEPSFGTADFMQV